MRTRLPATENAVRFCGERFDRAAGNKSKQLESMARGRPYIESTGLRGALCCSEDAVVGIVKSNS
jgi:hypothetical protein